MATPLLRKYLNYLRAAPRWLFLATLVYAPWAYGCTTSETIEILNWLLALVLALWLLGLMLERRVPELPPMLLVATISLLCLGWWMAWNASAIFDTDFSLFAARPCALPHAPGSVDEELSRAWMVRATVLLGLSCFVADLSRRAAWLMRVWQAIALAGGSIALLGLLQKASGAKMVFWEEAPARVVKTFFASYYYHANAGAYLNLVLPPTVGMALRMTLRPAGAVARALWPACALCVVLAVFANTSRVAQLLGLGLMLTVAVRAVRSSTRPTTLREVATIAAVGGVIVVTIFAVAQASRLDQPLARWEQLGSALPRDARWTVAGIALRSLPEAGWLGFGPGTFRVVFPYLSANSTPESQGVWRFLHEDYLQTLLEWGWLGSAIAGVIFFGGIAVAVRELRSERARGWMPRRRLLLPLIVLGLSATAVHALVDFPLQIASIQLYVATYVGLCWGSLAWRGEER